MFTLKLRLIHLEQEQEKVCGINLKKIKNVAF